MLEVFSFLAPSFFLNFDIVALRVVFRGPLFSIVDELVLGVGLAAVVVSS